MSWKPYKLDQIAQKLVIAAKNRDNDSLQETYKMRTTVAYGLERFWGEQLLGSINDRAYWGETWTELAIVMQEAGIDIPVDTNPQNQARQLWGDQSLPNSRRLARNDPNSGKFSEDDRKITLAILVQLCDCLVWWTQRYK